MKVIKFVLPLVLLTLTSCGPRLEPIDPAIPPKPLASDPAICAYSSEAPAVEGTIPRPQNEEEAEGIRAFLSSFAAWIDFGKEADRIAKLAQAECLIRVGGEPDHNISNTE